MLALWLCRSKARASDVEVGRGWELAIRQHLTLARAKLATNARLHVIGCSRPTILELSITITVLYVDRELLECTVSLRR